MPDLSASQKITKDDSDRLYLDGVRIGYLMPNEKAAHLDCTLDAAGLRAVAEFLNQSEAASAWRATELGWTR